MTVFDEVLFPLKTTFGSTGGPRRRTEIASLGSGAEERNAVWADSRREYAAGTLVKSRDDLHAVIAFFEARNAQLRAFRFRDPIDYRSGPPLKQPTATDQIIGTGDGATATFQLVKTYSSGAQSYTRAIKKPVAGTVKSVKVTTIGGVVQPGSELLEIVPLEDNLLVEARVKPRDIAYLRPGQEALVKITAYDFSIYGGFPAKLEYISADSILDEKNKELRITTTGKVTVEADGDINLKAGGSMTVEASGTLTLKGASVKIN